MGFLSTLMVQTEGRPGRTQGVADVPGVSPTGKGGRTGSHGHVDVSDKNNNG